MSKMPKVEVGQKVWHFDVNRRVYGPNGGAPIRAESWREDAVTYVGRTVVTVGQRRFRWEDGAFYGVDGLGKMVLTRAEVDDDIWIDAHRHVLADKVRACNDVALLKSVAALLSLEGK